MGEPASAGPHPGPRAPVQAHGAITELTSSKRYLQGQQQSHSLTSSPSAPRAHLMGPGPPETPSLDSVPLGIPVRAAGPWPLCRVLLVEARHRPPRPTGGTTQRQGSGGDGGGILDSAATAPEDGAP